MTPEERRNFCFVLREKGEKLRIIAEKLAAVENAAPLSKEAIRSLIFKGSREHKRAQRLLAVDVRELPNETLVSRDIICMLPLSVRTLNCLLHFCQETPMTLGALKQHLHVGIVILRTPNFGQKSLKELREFFDLQEAKINRRCGKERRKYNDPRYTDDPEIKYMVMP